MASGFCCFMFWEKVQQRRWTAFLSGISQLMFSELCRTSGLLWKGFVGSCLSKRQNKATLGTHLIQGFGGGLCFWRSIHVAYFVFSPGIGGKVFLFCLSFLQFEAWDVVLALILVAQSCSFVTRKAVDKMRKNNFKPLFLLSWKSLWKNEVLEPRRHWNPSSCSLRTLVINFTRLEKKGFSNNVSTFSSKCTPQTATVQLKQNQ